MNFKEEHAGKWVATKNHRVVDSSKNLDTLMGRVDKRKDKEKVRFALIPRRCIAGSLHGI
tara:strand:+ start:2479 stop:2658 length:180 start_codon:yes stop_codon:yes gene_type:complete